DRGEDDGVEGLGGGPGGGERAEQPAADDEQRRHVALGSGWRCGPQTAGAGIAGLRFVVLQRRRKRASGDARPGARPSGIKKEPPAIPSVPAAQGVLSFSPKQRTSET